MASTVKKIKSAKDSGPEQSIHTPVLQDRNARISELAYYKAEHREFEPGFELDDWLEAERELLE